MCAESSVAILSGDKEPLELYITVTHKQLFVRTRYRGECLHLQWTK